MVIIIIFFLRLWDYFRKTKFYEEYVKWWNCNDFLNMILLDLPPGELKQYFMGLLPSWNLFQLWLKRTDWCTIYAELSEEAEISFLKKLCRVFI